MRRFAGEPALQRAAARATRRHPLRRALPLPAPVWPATTLEAAVRSRRSTSELGGGELTLADLALVLAGAAGCTGPAVGPDGVPLSGRAAPSGGALYPLDLVVVPLRCPTLDRVAYRYDPERNALEPMPAGTHPGTLDDLLYQPELAASAGALVVVVATFARTRIKYGLRGYRFALLEAGHVVHGALLAAAAAELRAVPLGGLIERRLERRLGLDGVRESVVYAFAIGRPGGAP